ncbi:M24 family metallopeptidase [Aquibacillus salsiterrae]|uniref:Xaa-Pro peptidase family protein n=1 Tax=Aquibacillus salsiterrae TaxID=2950439 RepID=A0A9X4AF12_9BACI|nr:Xaa-Pro peptidase family protein [Aquibacillus salsiterrae]MDC3415765.1 Xaa-Pro peptidase family protein [Aquibacillus salsiterrae]
MTRINRLLQLLKENGKESIFVTSKANVYYLSNYYTDPHERLIGIYLNQNETPLFILPEMEKESALSSGWTGSILTYQDHENPWQLLKTYLTTRTEHLSSISIEKEHLSVSRHEQLKKIFPNAEISDGTNLLESLRIIKDKKEYQLLKDAAELADKGVDIGVRSLMEGKTELDIVAAIEYELKKQGIREMSFSTMVLSGKNTATPHGIPGLTTIAKGDLVLFDLGVVFEGYCSDITRTVAINHVSAEQRNMHETVLHAQEKAINAVKIGEPIGSLDQIARNHIHNNGYGSYFTHRLGHGIGIDVHEYPSMTSNNPLPIQVGMSFTIEPGIYVPHVGGVRIEDEVFVTDHGPELLTNYPKQLQIIDM